MNGEIAVKAVISASPRKEKAAENAVWNYRSSSYFALRQHRTTIVRQKRRQIFRQIA